MGDRLHTYAIGVTWTGNLGDGTSSYTDYSRDHLIECEGKPPLAGSSDPLFRGDSARYSPEDLFVASLAACHMLWYLHLCADAGIVVTGYVDRAVGKLLEQPGGGGRFEEVVLMPRVSVKEGANLRLATALHERAHELCFIAASVNMPVRCEPIVTIDSTAGTKAGVQPMHSQIQ